MVLVSNSGLRLAPERHRLNSTERGSGVTPASEERCQQELRCQAVRQSWRNCAMSISLSMGLGSRRR